MLECNGDLVSLRMIVDLVVSRLPTFSSLSPRLPVLTTIVDGFSHCAYILVHPGRCTDFPKEVLSVVASEGKIG